MNLKFNQSNFNSEYWQSLNKLGLPYYLYLGDELVIITNIEKRKRKKGAAIDQVYYTTEDGRTLHASYFRKVDIKTMYRDHLLNKILGND